MYINVVLRRRWWVVILSVLAAVVAIVVVAVASRIPFSSDILRARVVRTLSDRLDAEVELGDLALRIVPFRAVGSKLRVHHRKRSDAPPLISVETFEVKASLRGLWRRRVDHVRLEGLDIQISPDPKDTPARPPPPADARQPAEQAAQDPRAPDEASGGSADNYFKQVVITELEAPQARLTILRRDTTKPARVWSMHTLRLQMVGVNSKMPFDALLTNAVPPGEIATSGSFGPWARDDPGRTPLDGRFTFDNADLGVFDGISGILSAKGSFGGVLELIDINGETNTPDFMVNISGHQVPLTATYHAIVDGTNGDTTLDPVNATILRTPLVARGGVYEVEGGKGRIVRLDVSINSGRLEDVMRLAVKTAPPMLGQLHLQTKLELPPGKRDVVEKLKLDGRFAIERGRFTDPGVQSKINELSRRARGRPPSPETDAAVKVASNFAGRFRLGGGRLDLPVVTFNVPGAGVELGGAYELRKETIDFNGNLFMDAKVSQTVTGYKSLLLKIVDPLFLKDGRTVIPLKIGGTRADPQFGVDIGRALHRNSAAPAGPVGTNGRAPEQSPPSPKPAPSVPGPTSPR